MFVLAPFSIAHSSVIAGENAPCDTRRTRTGAGLPFSDSEERADARSKSTACFAPSSSAHKAQRGSRRCRIAPTAIPCVGSGHPFGGKARIFLSWLAQSPRALLPVRREKYESSVSYL